MTIIPVDDPTSSGKTAAERELNDEHQILWKIVFTEELTKEEVTVKKAQKSSNNQDNGTARQNVTETNRKGQKPPLNKQSLPDADNFGGT